MSRLAAVLAAALAISVPAAAQQGVTRANGGIMIDFPNTDIRLVVTALAEAAGLNLVYSELPQRTVHLRTSTPVPVEQVRVYLESLLRANGMELRDEGGGLMRVVSTTAPPAPAADQPAYPGGGRAQPGGMAIFVHPMRHAPAEDVARSLGALFGIGDGSFGGTERPRSLTDELRDQAIGPDGQPAAVQRDAAQGISAMLTGPVAIFPDQRTNSLLIRASRADYQTLADAITRLDTRPLQVLIEVVIAEVRRDRQFGLGVDFRIPDQPVDGRDEVIGGELPGGGSAGDVVLRIMRLGAVDANVVLRAIAASGDVTILSRPVVLAQNNEEARIMVGDQRPFIQISRALPTDNAARDQVIQYRDVGTRLTIRPTINPDGYVTLTVLQEVSTATDVTQFGAPVISTREAETRLLVKDGHTVVIGGLIDHTRTSTASGIPLLKDLPLVGPLFRSTTRRNNVSELFLFLIPHVLYSDEDVDSATQRVRERSPRLEDALPDSIPLYWDIRADTMAAPPAEQPRPQASPDRASVDGDSDDRWAALAVDRSVRRGRGTAREYRGTEKSQRYRGTAPLQLLCISGPSPYLRTLSQLGSG
ncbi:MAG TPA: secretin N-terminal domain-containing protein [Longimicrobium sp.]|nr:secretin N-terminal domain-containing protein [Longimicrobium sp.]